MRSLSVLFLVLVLSSCKPDNPAGATTSSQVPTYICHFSLGPDKQSEFIALLEKNVSPFNLRRYDAAPGLDELVGRRVFYASIANKEKTKLRALDFSDVKNQERVELFIYSEYFDRSDEREQFLMTVEATIQKFDKNFLIQHCEYR